MHFSRNVAKHDTINFFTFEMSNLGSLVESTSLLYGFFLYCTSNHA